VRLSEVVVSDFPEITLKKRSFDLHVSKRRRLTLVAVCQIRFDNEAGAM
jgi:hypothetical protein